MAPRSIIPGAMTARRRARWAFLARRGVFASAARLAAVAMLFLCIATARPALAEEPPPKDLADLSLEQLTEIEITSVSGRAERLSDAAASVYVITSEDIRRAGATSLPEALRLAPTLQVSRADANQYAITARGFNSVIANNLLVLIDGRTVYSPLFSGVFWEAQDVVLEDVDRIEVISGPGGTLWGTNAVNGVINIITRSATETRGVLAAAGVGDQVRVGTARYGGPIGSSGSYRVRAKYRENDATERSNGTSVGDASERFQGGFRADWEAPTRTITLEGAGYRGDIDQGPTTRKVRGYHLLGRWTRQLPEGTTLRFQAYYDRSERRQPGSIDETLDTWDLEFHNGFRAGRRHQILWGAGYRYQPDRVDNVNPAALAFLPADRNLRYGHVFLEDEIVLDRTLHLVAGLKLEHNVYTGLEALPTARLAWKPTPGQLVWSAFSRAVRAPARVDRDLFIPGVPPFVGLAGGPDFRSEISRVTELGYRAQPWVAVSFSVTAFLHDHDRLRSLEPSPAGPVFGNGIEGDTHGAELWGSYRVTPAWRLSGGLVEQRRRLRRSSGSNAPIGAGLGNDPNHWWTLRSAIDLGTHFELDASVRHVAELPSPVVPAYTCLDARFGWRVLRDLELSVAGFDLIGNGHAEWGAPAARPEFNRSVFVQLRWRT